MHRVIESSSGALPVDAIEVDEHELKRKNVVRGCRFNRPLPRRASDNELCSCCIHDCRAPYDHMRPMSTGLCAGRSSFLPNTIKCERQSLVLRPDRQVNYHDIQAKQTRTYLELDDTRVLPR